MNKTILCTLLVAAATHPFGAHAAKDAWNSANNPANFDADHDYVYHYDTLKQIKEGGLPADSHRGWADSYWPMVNGWIADRWQVPNSEFKDDKTPSNLSNPHTIDLLSPAEKFDLARGRLDFPLVSQMRKKLKRKGKDWRGLCNGWVHSSLNYNEPHPFVYTNPQTNMKIPFGSGDVKGLLAYYHGHLEAAKGAQVGLRCTTKGQILDVNGECSDVNPGAFHVVMVNEMGRHNRGFAADEDAGQEVWNQPFTHYTTVETNRTYSGFDDKAADGTAAQVSITSTLTYVNELYEGTGGDENLEDAAHVHPSYYPVLGTPKQVMRKDVYTYDLDLDSAGNIIGGRWTSKKHPDFLWRQNYNRPGMAKDMEGNSDDWSLLNTLVEQATAYTTGKF